MHRLEVSVIDKEPAATERNAAAGYARNKMAAGNKNSKLNTTS
jgi:hypothetical protein